jgi:hypothetical protein
MLGPTILASGDSASILSIRPTIQEKREDVSIIFKGAC